MAEIVTNRDLYLAVSQLIAQYRGQARPLEEYLRALWGEAHLFHEQAALTPGEFFRVLGGAFTAEPVTPHDGFVDAVAEHLPALENATPGYQGWEYRVVRQVIDLREMAEAGQFADPLRYLGIDAPRGSRWYNFDPCTFLECGMAGTFGGWEEGDDTDRGYVSGEVGVMGPDGQITGHDPRELDDLVAPLGDISWEQFRYFLLAGQAYE